jgi:cyclase
VVAVDVKRRAATGGWDVYVYGGHERTSLDAMEWMAEVEKRGAGEILLTSMDRDGTQQGYDVQLLRDVASRVSIPVIASGGAGRMEHFAEAFQEGRADAALAASLFHSRSMKIGELKSFLAAKGVPVR